MSDVERAILQRFVRLELDRRGLASLARWCPHLPTERQLAFLASEAFESLYGGAAGGGKSDALLMDHARFFDVPGYAGLLLRRTYTDLSLPGALMDRARAWWATTGASWNDREKRWTFPSGASLSFGYCESPQDVFRYQGSELHRIGVDELTQWEERPYRYLLGRIRRVAGVSVPLGMRAATNPGGVGHSWVKSRFIEPPDSSRPFIPAKIDDNPHLDRAEYRRALSLLDDTTRDQLERGLWLQDEAGRIYRYEAERNACAAIPERDDWRVILAVDLGASEREPTSGFVVVLWHPHDQTTYIAEAWKEAGLTPSSLAERIKATEARYRESGCVWDGTILDEGALGRGYGNEMRARHGIAARAAEKRDKLGYRKLLNGAFRDGRIKLRADSCRELISELDNLLWNPAGTDAAPGLADHISDALLYGWRMARSYASQTPATLPAHGTPEHSAQQAREWRERERTAWQRKQDSAPGEDW